MYFSNLGVGKTVIAKGFIQSRLGEAVIVTSPTFVIDIEYQIPNETLK
jgi:tRNA A37 threonylcarbamoyladenosine biosynthesis protein TsaE